MTTQTQTAPVTKPRPMRVAVTRKIGAANDQGHRDAIITRVGRVYAHGAKPGFNVIFDQTPVLGKDGHLVIFAGGKGDKFPEGAPKKLSVFDVVPYTDKQGVEKKQWNRVGTALLSKNGGAYDLLLDALPHNGKLTCIVPTERKAETKTDEPQGEEAPF